MSFNTLPWWILAAGVPLIACALYLLQRLRSERRYIAFAAASLWARMPRATPDRVRGGRFRYWLAFLLSLLIALLLWLATANPVGAPPGDENARLFYLDSSAVLAGNDGAARRALLADVRLAPAAHRAVILGDATGTPLLAPGESVSLLAARLDRVAAGGRPSTFAQWLRDRATRMPAGRTLAVRYYGSWAGAGAAAASLPRDVRLDYGYMAAAVPDNRGIVALGASPAGSGRSGRADILISVAGPNGRIPVPDDLATTHDGRAIPASALTTIAPGRYVIRDVVADGGQLSVRLRDGDGFAADDRAALRLPDRRVIRVAIVGAVPATIRAAVAADDGAVIASPAQADVVVRSGSAEASGNTPALVLAAAGDGAAFTFTAPGQQPADLQARLAEFGLDRIDSAGLADATGRPIAVDIRTGNPRTIAAWSAIFTPGTAFARSPALPLFVSQAMRWLADERGWTPYAKAGAALPDQSALDGWAGRPLDADSRLVGATALGDTGEVRIGNRPVTVSLTDPMTTAVVRLPPPADVDTVSRASASLPPNLIFFALVLAALLLLAAEWVAYQRGRIP